MSHKTSRVHSMELLAPAGSFGAFEAALAEGADAVYLGAPGLNARALSRDFTIEEIGAMVEYAHRRDVKVYVAMNSLVKESELPLGVESLAQFETMGADAVIVQDLGLLRLAARYFPNLPVHASTLMSVHNSCAVQSLVSLGCRRVVLPRELTIEEIGRIQKQTGAEIEVFVHGAMCFSYSGLCLFSSLHGGKSSLRGQCVQPCRRKYSWLKKSARGAQHASGKGGGYLFSMNDLCAIDLLPELAAAGVKSLKIEGRLKSAEYVRKTVMAYRLMLDNCYRTDQGMQKVREEARLLLDEAMGRKRSPGFFLGGLPENLINPHLSGNVGTMVGKVERLETGGIHQKGPAGMLTVSLRQVVRIGDRLRLHDEKTGSRTAFTLRTVWLGGRKVQQAGPGQRVRIEVQQKIAGKPQKSFQGSLFRVDIGTGRFDEKKAREKILKQGKSSSVPDNVRIREIMSAILPEAHAQGMKGGQAEWWIRVSSFRDMLGRFPVSPVRYVLPMSDDNMQQAGNLHGQQRDRVIWSLPPVVAEDRLSWYREAAAALMAHGYLRFQIGHFSHSLLWADLAKETPGLEIYCDYTVNALNSVTLDVLRQEGLAGTLFSIETDRVNLEEAFSNIRRRLPDFRIGMYVYGRPPLFTARLDDRRFEYGRRFASPKGEEYFLSRSDGLTIARPALPFSLLGEWKNLLRMGVDYLVVDLETGSMKRNVSEFISHLKPRGGPPGHMSGNYLETLV